MEAAGSAVMFDGDSPVECMTEQQSAPVRSHAGSHPELHCI